MSEGDATSSRETAAVEGPFLSLRMPPRVYVPLASGRGNAGEPVSGLVGVGDALASAGADGLVARAPCVGRVFGVREVQLTNGRLARAVEIETEAEGESAQLPAATLPQSAAELLSIIARAGVWADRKTSPDLLGQLDMAMRRPVESVVCNLLEADNAPLNASLAMAHSGEILRGALATARALGARVQVIAQDETAGAIQSAARASGDSSRIRVIPMRNDYPQADPTILVYMLSGRRLRPGRLPVEQGMLMIDGPAAAAVESAVHGGLPALALPLAVRHRGTGRVQLVQAMIGTPLRFVLRELAIPQEGVTIRAGVALRDMRIGVDAVVSGGELRLDVAASAPPTNPDPCIRCGWCVAACPTRIHPAGLLEATQEHDEELAEHYGIGGCIRCGICSYVCPSRLPLLEAIRSLQDELSARTLAGSAVSQPLAGT